MDALANLLDGPRGRDAFLLRSIMQPPWSVRMQDEPPLGLIAVIRAWFSRPEADVPDWYSAQQDPVVGQALRLLHDNPAHPWTVASLAAKTGRSRSALARCFTDRVGVPPMTYLKEWRLARTADLLLDPHNTLDTIARRVGYSDGFTLSTAFKGARGISPQQYRDTAAARADSAAERPVSFRS